MKGGDASAGDNASSSSVLYMSSVPNLEEATALSSELSHTPVFDERPSDQYIAEWADHISATGYPETFDRVTTSKPAEIGDLVLLSGELRVPTVRRADQALVPCPICNPNSPKFGVGRMAWFPGEAVVRFIGHDCAKRHFKDFYRRAEGRYATENNIRRMQRRWAQLQPSLDLMESIVRASIPMAKALEDLRHMIDAQARGLSRLLYREFTRAGGRLELTEDTGLKDQNGAPVYRTYSLGVVRGANLFGKFVPYQELLTFLDVIADLRNPLPPWSAGDEDAATEAEILARGKEANLLPERIISVIDRVHLARGFLYRDNLALIERWGRNTGSPFKSLVCGIQQDDRLVIRSITFEGAHFANPVLPDGVDDELPTIPASIIELQRETMKYRWPTSNF